MQPPPVPQIPPELIPLLDQISGMMPAITVIAIAAIIAFFGTIAVLGWKVLGLFTGRKKQSIAETEMLQKENRALRDRIENLENVVCRLDQEINSQLEKSISLFYRPDSGNSLQLTTAVNIASALEGRYQLLQEVGRGGMGIVFQAYDKQLKENVAVKVLSPFLSHDSESLERLRREVTAARKITHGNVIKIFDIAEAGGLHYITMEYFPGENLRQWVTRRGPLSFQEGLQILLQICDGLEAAHSQGIIHRDLKSQNVIINEKGQLKIIDLGLARTTQLEGMTATGLIMGTPEYMSPEQVMGKRTDERSDLYSVGVILYELFAGKVPFSGNSAIAVGYKHLKESWTPLSSLNIQLPESISSIADRLLQKDPAHRYQSIQELRRDLQQIQGFAPVKAMIESEMPQPGAERKTLSVRTKIRDF